MCAKRIVAFVAWLVVAGSIDLWVSVVRSQGAACLVNTTQGEILGLDRGASCAYLGVPFGKPPVGDLRWKPPVPAAAWAPAVLSAGVAPPACPQINLAGLPAGSEDCLAMNIWAPYTDVEPSRAAHRRHSGSHGRRGRPVIVWFHPGSFVAASSNLGSQNGENLVEQTGAIVVAPNYRLGALGFLGHSALRAENAAYPTAGNYGLLDQRLALEWVRDHIASFGGDPHRITIAGQSAGGLSVSLHLVSPGSDGLFARAIMQGGFASYRWRTRADAEAQADAFATALGCTDSSQVLACLRSKTRDEVLRALPTGQEQFAETGRTHWGPTIDGFEIPDQPRTLFAGGAFSRVPVIIGANRDEGWTWVSRSFPATMTSAQYETALASEFGADAASILNEYPADTFATPRDALAQVVTDAEYTCGAQRLARSIARRRTDVYVYSFNYEIDAVTPDRAFHGLDVNLVFGNNFGPPSNHVLAGPDLDLFHAIGGYWTRFAATGNPNSHDESAVRWPRFKRASGKGHGATRHLVLDQPITQEKLARDACAFWEPSFFRSITAAVPAWTP